MKIERRGRRVALRFRRWAVHVLLGWFRPSLSRHSATDPHRHGVVAEYGTLRLGIVQIKWTRLIGQGA